MPECFLFEAVLIFCNLRFQDGHHLRLLKVAQNVNYFKFVQIGYSRWPSGAVTNNSINTKITISQELLVEIDPTLCQTVSCIKPF